MTDAEKAKQYEQEAEDLRDQLEALTNRVKQLEAAVGDDESRISTLQEKLTEAEEIIKEQDTTKAKLVEAVTLKHQDDQEAVSSGSDTETKFKRMKERYLDLAGKLAEKDDTHKRHVQQLREKLEDRDKELKDVRAGMHPPHSSLILSSSLDLGASLEDPAAEVERLAKLALASKVKIEGLERQVGTFQSVASEARKAASEREQIHEHSKEQSRVVVELKDEIADLKVLITSNINFSTFEGVAYNVIFVYI